MYILSMRQIPIEGHILANFVDYPNNHYLFHNRMILSLNKLFLFYMCNVAKTTRIQHVLFGEFPKYPTIEPTYNVL